MPAIDFRTIPDELLHVAADAEGYFLGLGFNVSLEIRELGFPFVPALICRLGHETVIVDVSSSLDQKRADRWIRFCNSQTSDTRFCVVIRSTSGVDGQTMGFAIDRRIGLYVHNDDRFVEVRPSSDLALHVALPDLADLPPKVRPLLAPAFRKFDAGDWRDGVFHTYGEVEQHAREYLKAGILNGRIVVPVTQRRTVIYRTAAEVDKMTLGQLSGAFGSIQNQTQKDAQIGSCLALINKTRIGLVHMRRRAEVEAELRRFAGQHMYAAITALEDLT